MLLAIDVGNTNTTFGVFDGDALIRTYRLESVRTRTSDEYAVFLSQLFAMHGIDRRQIETSIIASVVPPLTEPMVSLVKMAFGHEPLVVGPGTKTHMPILVENPREVGADRIVNAVAAYERYNTAAIVVDFGTATTFDCVSAKGEYLGGVICPGIQISADALFSRAAKLPRVEVAPPAKVIGKNTVASMQSGIVFGYVALVDGLVDRVSTEMGVSCKTIATGGLARVIAPLSRTIADTDLELTLHGLRSIFQRNVRPAGAS
jgi:type III pantothenate kinase